jgi:hypothetical protein
MTTTHARVESDYASGYATGRDAAKDRLPSDENPFRPGSAAFHGWNDGHYDEQSARIVAIKRHSALIWADSDAN